MDSIDWDICICMYLCMNVCKRGAVVKLYLQNYTSQI